VKTLGDVFPDNRAFAIGDERFPLIIGNDEFREDLALVFNINGELGKEVFFILVDAAEPIVMGYSFHARDAEDLVAIGHRERLNDGDFVDDVEAINTGQVHALIECAVNDHEKSKEEERDGERADG
jgi:hypothetical protein